MKIKEFFRPGDVFKFKDPWGSSMSSHHVFLEILRARSHGDARFVLVAVNDRCVDRYKFDLNSEWDLRPEKYFWKERTT